MGNIDIQLLDSSGNATIPVTNPGDTHTMEHNSSVGEGCIKVVFSEMEFLPWNNPENIVTERVEIITRNCKDTILALFFLIGGPANLINMVVFYKQGLQERVNVCLFALSLADELYLITLIILHGEQLHLQFISQEMYGPLFTLLVNSRFTVFLGFQYVSPILSTIIAMERCHCVMSPLKYQTAMKTRTMTIIVIALSLLIMGLFFIVCFRYGVGCIFDPETGVVTKTAILGEFYRANKHLITFLHGTFFGFVLPWLEIVVVTSATIITVVKLRQVLSWRGETSSSISPREVALTKMLVGSSILFIVCLFPSSLTIIVWFLFPEMNIGDRYQNFFFVTLWLTQVLSFVNSTFNFFVYYVMGSRYRETLWALFGKNPKATE
ncbi:hypothetical protein ACOMHN_040340 [Nucella lapillus]